MRFLLPVLLAAAAAPAMGADAPPAPPSAAQMHINTCAGEYRPTLSGSGSRLTVTVAATASSRTADCANLRVVGWEVAAADGKFEDAAKSPLVNAKADGGTLTLAAPEKAVTVRPVLAGATGSASGMSVVVPARQP